MLDKLNFREIIKETDRKQRKLIINNEYNSLQELLANKINSPLKGVFHFIISPPPAKNFDIEIIFLRSCVAEDTCSAGPVVENFHLLFDLSLTARKNN